MRIGTSYKQNPLEESWDAIIIGSGIGGLATAGMLARMNKKVLVLERHYTAGGFTHTFSRPNFEWDVGVHYIGEVQRPHSLHRRIFDHLSDGELKWADMGEVYDTIVIGGDRYEFHRGQRNFIARMKAYFPRETKEIDRYMERVTAASRHSKLFFMEKALPNGIARLLGPLLRRRGLPFAEKTVAQVFSEIGIKPESRLAGVLTGQYGDYGLPPGQASFLMHALLVMHYMNGAAYPVGGSSEIARCLIKPIENRAGKVMTSAEVTSINFNNNRACGVTLVDGHVLKAPIVVSDAGWDLTWGHLVPKDLPRPEGWTTPLPTIPPSFGHAALYVGIDKEAKDVGLTPSNIWVYPHEYHDRNVANYIKDPKNPLPLAFLSFPSAKDPTFSHRFPGRSTVEVIGFLPWERVASYSERKWHKRGEEYDSLKSDLEERLLDVLYQQCPRVRGHVVHRELSTPVTTKHFTAHPHGEIYGLSHSPARFLHRQLRPQTPFKGFYLTGSDICSAGVTGALMGAILATSVIARKNVLERI